ncbi:twin-arginine translocation signal domain-containing protein, partial [Shigella sonnei]
MKIHTTEALMKAEISRRSLMKTSALGSLALASSAFTLPFSQMVRAAEAPVEEKAVWSVTNGAIVIHTQRLKSDPG